MKRKFTDKELQSLLREDFTLAANEVRIGLFAVHLRSTSYEALKKMRKLFPHKEYTLLRNRVSARHNRSKARDMAQRL